MSVTFDLPTAEATRAFGASLARLLEPGDLLLLVGELGAGKTTLTQGLGAGLEVRGPVASPTFVISRVHPSLADGPALVHVDAYRLGGYAELDDLDLDTGLDTSITVVEWGSGIAEQLSSDYLVIELVRAPGGPAAGTGAPDGPAGFTGPGEDDPRQAHVHGVGDRWEDADLSGLAPRPAG